MRYVALLRAVNVGGHRKVPMADLRKLAEQIGLSNPSTYVASGNLVFDSKDKGPALEKKLEHALADRFGFPVEVMVRSADEWAGYAANNPMPDQAADKPNLLMLSVGKRPATDADVEALRRRASPAERVERAGDVIWIWFGDGSGRSKIGTGAATKEFWTTRNWRSVVKLQELLAGD